MRESLGVSDFFFLNFFKRRLKKFPKIRENKINIGD